MSVKITMMIVSLSKNAAAPRDALMLNPCDFLLALLLMFPVSTHGIQEHIWVMSTAEGD